MVRDTRCLAAISLLIAAACAKPSAPALTPPPPSSPPPAAPSAEAPPPVSPPPEAAPAKPPPSNEPALASVCLGKCDKLAARCAKTAVENCRLSCAKYEGWSGGCDQEVRAALACARDAADVSCANVAPESCGPKFRDAHACTSGSARATAEDKKDVLPAGWQELRDASVGFSVPMPSGAAPKTVDGHTQYAAKGADGTDYTLDVLPPPSDKPSEKTLLRVLTKLLGRCSDKLKLDGFIEKPEYASIHFASRCADGTEWQGMLYINQKQMLMLNARAPAGKLGVTEPFFYQLQYLH
jgi:hypothetical protein